VLGSVPLEDPAAVVEAVVLDRRAGGVDEICEMVACVTVCVADVDVGEPADATAGNARTALIQAVAAANLTDFTSRKL
jgi:hypothetical protein